ncbi:hypothetical protein A2191_04315 [Candidatus Woesebacteria bacterium RIFOXYA1_FULL_38_9]|nr:MAG: hypothetical protein A2191_04315 [Candidatus Woesebacteria bacterium RIFOXYA1_FULL_38_9]
MDVFYTTTKNFRESHSITKNSQIRIGRKNGTLNPSADRSTLILSGILKKQALRQKSIKKIIKIENKAIIESVINEYIESSA